MERIQKGAAMEELFTFTSSLRRWLQMMRQTTGLTLILRRVCVRNKEEFSWEETTTAVAEEIQKARL